MPRKKKHQRSDGRFEYKATVGRKLDGTPIRKSFYSMNSLSDAKRQAELYKQQQTIAAVTGTHATLQTTTFAGWAEKWLLTYKKPFVSPSTYANTYCNMVEHHLIPYFGAAPLEGIHPVDIQDFFASKSACSESALSKMRSILNAIFESAIDNDLLYKNPAKHIRFSSGAEKREKKALSDEQIDFVARAGLDRLDEVPFLLYTGMRRGEMLGLMWQDIDFETKSISIQRAIVSENGKAVVRPPKWDSYRKIPLMKDALQILNSMERISLYVFPARRTLGPQNPNNFSRKLRQFNGALPEECRCSAHELRHSYASQLMRHGVDIYTISKLLGHRDIKVTAKTYVHPDVDAFRAELDSKVYKVKAL